MTNQQTTDTITCFAALSTLQPGDRVPATLYVADYANGARPSWTVVERKPMGHGWRLLLVDPDCRDLFDQVAVVVLTFPGKTLRTPPQLHNPDAPAVVTGKLCDMLQQGRYAAKARA